MTVQKKYFFFVLIVLANIILKILYADHSPFSYDEIISVKDTLMDFGHIKHEAEWDNNPPFFYYCLWVWHKIIPVSELNSRLLSIIFVSLAIGLSFLFAQKYFDNKTAFFSAVLLSLSNFLTYYAQETRTYSLVLLLTMLSSLQFFRYIHKSTLVNLLLLSLINFLIIYSHYISGLVVVVQYVTVVLFHKPKIRQFVLIQTLFISALVFLRFTKKQFLNILNYNHKNDFWLQNATFRDLKNAVSELFFDQYTGLFFILVMIVFSFYAIKNKSQGHSNVKFYGLSIGFLSVLFLYVLGTFKALFLARYLIFCIPFAVMIISYQLLTFKTAGHIILIALVVFQSIRLNLKKENKINYQEMAAIIKKHKNSKDYVIINTRDNVLLFEYYYDKEKFMKYKNIDSVAQADNIYGVNDVESMSSINIPAASKVFLLQSFHKINSEKNPINNYLANKFQIIYQKESLSGIEFHLYHH